MENEKRSVKEKFAIQRELIKLHNRNIKIRKQYIGNEEKIFSLQKRNIEIRREYIDNEVKITLFKYMLYNECEIGRKKMRGKNKDGKDSYVM